MLDLVTNESYPMCKSYKEFKSILQETDSKKKDQKVQFKDWSVVPEGFKIGKKVYPMYDSGMITLLKLFKMPVDFYFKTSPTDMTIKDINRMNDEFTEESELIVYFLGDVIRAVSDPNVGHVKDHTMLLDSLGIKQDTFHRGSYSDYGLRITTKLLGEDTKPIKVERGDIINIGMEVMYSDIGVIPTTGYPHLLRLVCTNGAVMSEKSDFLHGFRYKFTVKDSENEFLKLVSNSVKEIVADTGALSNTFKAMKDNSIKVLRYGEEHMKKIRSAMGGDSFDKLDALTTKVQLAGEKEKVVINTDTPLYNALDIVTREAKKYSHFERGKIERLAGGLISKSMYQFVKAAPSNN